MELTAGFNAAAADRFSQGGEDGIIAALVDRLPGPTRWCVEFGAHDGVSMSNTRALIVERNFRAVLIEGDPELAAELERAFQHDDRVHTLQAMVGWTAADGLDAILAGTDIPKQFDVLSVDIDGNDYHAWKAVTAYRPRIVVIEFNPTADNDVDFVQPPDPALQWGCSPRALVDLATDKGYQLVATTMMNCVFVDAEFFALLDIPDNSLAALRSDETLVTRILTGYDGSLHLAGAQIVFGSGAPMVEQRMQAIPRALQGWPFGMGRIRQFALRAWIKYLKVRYR